MFQQDFMAIFPLKLPLKTSSGRQWIVSLFHWNTLLTMTQLQTSLLERLVTLNIFIFRLTRSKAKDDQGCSNTVHYPSLSSIILRKQILEALIFLFLIISTMVLHPSTDGWFSFVDTVQCPLCV